MSKTTPPVQGNRSGARASVPAVRSDRMSRLIRGEITIDDYVRSVKREVRSGEASIRR